MDAYKFVVLTNPAEGRDDEFNAWYDGRHLEDVLKVPGFVGAQRLEVAPFSRGAPPKFKYMTIYDIESDDVEKTFEAFFSSVGTERMPISDGMARGAGLSLYRVRGPKEK
jgi:hypothetical protein